MKGRRISCNIRQILDLIDYSEEEQISAVILSIDFEKAFDRVETKSLLDAMTYFNIGDSFKQWTQLIYNNVTACVTNQVFFTEWFQISHSVKQGGCCSVYYFLILAEVLAIEIRKNPKIQGVILNDIKKVLGQYADDIDLYLLGHNDTLNATLNTFEHFEKNSGLKINYDKTTVYRLGALCRSNAKMYTKQKLKWMRNTEPINILGVHICRDTMQLMKVNYKPVILKCQAILNNWQKRGLSLAGKITIINLLIFSQFVYKQTVLPSMPELYIKQINQLIENFIWDGKKPKIPLQVLQCNKLDGGMGLIDIKLLDIALKASWVQIITSDSMVAELAFLKLDPILRDLIWQCNIK